MFDDSVESVPHAALDLLAERESNARTYARSIDRVLTKGELAVVHDSEGRRYLDCLACAGALPLGHNHPYVMERVTRFLASGHVLQGLDIATPAKATFVDELYRVLPPAFAANAKLQFCGPSGADAVEAVIKLFKTATGRRSVLAFHGAYHGMTMGAMSLMGNIEPKRAVAGHMSEVFFLPYPNAYRCPFGVGGEPSDTLSLSYIEHLLSDPESGITPPALIILEAVQGEGGCIPASAAWLKGLAALAMRHSIPLVIDEVQTGFARTGTMFAHEHADIVPDAIVMSKAVGGGFPLALIAYHRQYDSWNPGAHAGTFRGNQIALVAGAATLRYLRENDIPAATERIGARLRAGLEALQQRFDCIGDVRGRGLMLGVEIVNPHGLRDARGLPPADGALAKRLKRECLQQGLIIEAGGRHGAVLRLLPPLVLTEPQVEEILKLLNVALTVCTSPVSPPRHAGSHAAEAL
ncbi:diaminobutyrate--2-oxoglutarate transaminase family protein [Paraburkholderia sp. MMS20-SJTR3]|uniref:Diaminobutyrate--2-oxoglutarate transaminase family protein n=1 Tax=Paraburkholderia sejongensis TaxID=2886946 RepID=A0ABS8K594_9BURK|nr:diaminobutyrate--2-oxoglutarate transaminase family protein [Paraburkholderia sp. MMS20-SJTR3]MCC8397339.1 diaminobutyrate--2-oxoglutarate transaminase family protein [Paraburkholderia sp. MMS20-SJTR3]